MDFFFTNNKCNSFSLFICNVIKITLQTSYTLSVIEGSRHDVHF